MTGRNLSLHDYLEVFFHPMLLPVSHTTIKVLFYVTFFEYYIHLLFIGTALPIF